MMMTGICRSITRALNWWDEPESLCGCQSILRNGDLSRLIISIVLLYWSLLWFRSVYFNCKRCAFSRVFAHTLLGAPCLGVSSTAMKNKHFGLKFPPCVLFHALSCSFCRLKRRNGSNVAAPAGDGLGTPAASQLPQTTTIHSLCSA